MFLENFHYNILGTNASERVVFIHGLMAFAANWRKIATSLESDYQCLIYDQRGHGRSFKPENGYKQEDFAEDLNRITDELGWDRFHLVGHSMGGKNAMVFSYRYPKKVRTLTIEDVGPDITPKVLGYYQRMLESVPTPFSSREEVKSFFQDEFSKVFSAKEPLNILGTFLQANIEGKPNGTYDWRFSKQAIYETVISAHQKDRWFELSQLKLPVLLIRGEKSHVFSHEEYAKMLAVNSNIEGVEVPEAGHWLHYEKSDEFVQILRDFIDRHRGA